LPITARSVVKPRRLYAVDTAAPLLLPLPLPDDNAEADDAKEDDNEDEDDNVYAGADAAEVVVDAREPFDQVDGEGVTLCGVDDAVGTSPALVLPPHDADDANDVAAAAAVDEEEDGGDVVGEEAAAATSWTKLPGKRPRRPSTSPIHHPLSIRW
jgi:hypothetical protein